MLSIDFIRNNKEKVILASENKNRQVDLDQIIALDDQRRLWLQQIQRLREERNRIAKDHDKGKRDRGREIKTELAILESNLRSAEEKLNILLSQVPNIPLDEVPVGSDDSGNVEIKKWGEIPKFNFTPRSHIEIGEKLDIIDTTRGVKVSGFRGYFLKNEGAILQMALLMYVFQKLIGKGYTPIIAPSIVKGFTLYGSGQFPWGEGEVYQLNDNDAYLAGTAEVPVTALFSGEILDIKALPKKMVAFSPCFRREAGSYGKDTKGIYRLHEFWKIEQVIISEAQLGEAKKFHQELQQNTEDIWQELELPYRVVMMCTGDMGEPQILKFDTEVWMPSRQNYGEVASNSIMGDFQARRLNLRYRDFDGQMKFCYTLNNTAIATPRALVAILENNQQKDGSVAIPKVLQPLAGFDKIEPK